MRSFFKVFPQIASDVMAAFAIALDLPKGFFDERHWTHANFTPLALSTSQICKRRSTGAGAHTDYGHFTVLFQDAAGGFTSARQTENG